MIARPSAVVSLDLPPVSRNYRDISCDDEARSVHHGECNLERLTRTVGTRERRSERNSCKSGESSGDMARQLSKIRWNLEEKANAPEKLPPQLVIRRFLPAFMRPFLAVFIGKIFSPGIPIYTPSESRRAGQSEDLVLARPSRSRARSSCILLFSSPLQMHSPRGSTRARALSSSLIEYSPLYLRMPVEIYRRSRCSFRFNLLRTALTSSALSFLVFVLCASNVISFSSSIPFLFFLFLFFLRCPLVHSIFTVSRGTKMMHTYRKYVRYSREGITYK